MGVAARFGARVVIAAGLAAGICSVVACSSDDPKAMETGVPVTAADETGVPGTSPTIPRQAVVQFRAVQEVTGPDPETPCGRDDLDQLAATPVLVAQCAEGGVAEATFLLGPTLLDGSAIEDASAGLGQGGQWIVNPTFRMGPEGIDAFNSAAAPCAARNPECPTGQLALVVDGEVITAPTIEEASFERDQIQISGSFTEESAKDLVLVLRWAAVQAGVPDD